MAGLQGAATAAKANKSKPETKESFNVNGTSRLVPPQHVLQINHFWKRVIWSDCRQLQYSNWAAQLWIERVHGFLLPLFVSRADVSHSQFLILLTASFYDVVEHRVVIRREER